MPFALYPVPGSLCPPWSSSREPGGRETGSAFAFPRGPAGACPGPVAGLAHCGAGLQLPWESHTLSTLFVLKKIITKTIFEPVYPPPHLNCLLFSPWLCPHCLCGWKRCQFGDGRGGCELGQTWPRVVFLAQGRASQATYCFFVSLKI